MLEQEACLTRRGGILADEMGLVSPLTLLLLTLAPTLCVVNRGKPSNRKLSFRCTFFTLTMPPSLALMVANRSEDKERYQVLVVAPLALLDQ